MTKIVMTNHFRSLADAECYYVPYGYHDVSEAVTRKLAEGDICIGPPTAEPGEVARLDGEGRYWIEAP